MKTSKRITLNLTPEEVKQAVIERFLDKDEQKLAKATIKMAVETRGYGMGEYDELVFKGIDLVVEM